MCTEAQDFDLRCRGAYQLAESWQASPQLKLVWKLEDIVSLYNEYLPKVIAAYESYCKTGIFSGEGTLVMNLYQVREFARHGKNLLEIADKEPASHFVVAGVEDLRRYVAAANQIVSEEDFATNMSLLNFSES